MVWTLGKHTSKTRRTTLTKMAIGCTEKLAVDNKIPQLQNEVMKYLKEGYIPHGDPYATGDFIEDCGKRFHSSAQAMIKNLAPASQQQPLHK